MGGGGGGDRKKIAEERVIEGKREEGKDVRKRKGSVEEKCVCDGERGRENKSSLKGSNIA